MTVWKLAAVILSVATALAPIVIEVSRAVVQRRRRQLGGIGGTQDVAMAGTFIGLGCAVLAAVCWAIWYFAE